MNNKQASLQDILGKLDGRLGANPSMFPGGGALMAPIIQGLITGGLGYGAGRLAGSFMPGIDAHRLGVVAGLGSATLPWFAHKPWLAANMKKWKEKQGPVNNWWERPVQAARDPLDFLRSMNAPYWKEASMEKAGFSIGAPSNLPEGYGIPVAHTLGMIRTDPLLDPVQKARAMAIVEAAQPKRTGIISWPTVSRAAVGAGVGLAGATLFGKALDTLFGGLSSSAQRKLQGAGTIAGILLNTGAIR